jgi:hypothetical protein
MFQNDLNQTLGLLTSLAAKRRPFFNNVVKFLTTYLPSVDIGEVISLMF